jgi:nicotinate-nucleotide adenylyltransferase
VTGGTPATGAAGHAQRRTEPVSAVGIFGGTFDPPHVGHLIVAQDAALALGLDRLLFVPSASPPHKQDVDVSPARLRARMLALAIDGDPRFEMDTLELDRSGASYTVDTLRALTADRPGVDWTLLMGADQYEEFDTWREPAEIRKLARVAVLTRGGQVAEADTLSAGHTATGRSHAEQSPVWQLAHGDIAVEVTRIDVSATALRARVAAGKPIRYLVPPAVEQFIFEQHLYTRNGTPVAGYHPGSPPSEE